MKYITTTLGPQSTSDAWWEHAAGIMRVSLKTTGRTLRDLISDLDRIADLGFDAIELFAPCHGGNTYEGLDVVDFYAVDPALGTMEDFDMLADECRRRGIALIVFLNLGYLNEHHATFLRACDDRAQGLTSPATKLFLWADAPDEQIPFAPDSHFLQGSSGQWHWSDRARSYYWVKWEGEFGGHPLPQLNWGDAGWREEARRVVDFWRAAGADGIVLDAVNWYVGCDWPTIRELSMDSGVRTYSHPEGAGGFGDAPVPWITSGGFTVLMDYSLKIWWDQFDLVEDVVLSGKYGLLEQALQSYRDPVDAAGGICYINPTRPGPEGAAGARLVAAVVATVGELYYLPYGIDQMSAEELEISREMLQLRRAYPALTARGPRSAVPCSNVDLYTFVRGAGVGRVLVAFNFTDGLAEGECEVHGESIDASEVPMTRIVVSLPPRAFTVIELR